MITFDAPFARLAYIAFAKCRFLCPRCQLYGHHCQTLQHTNKPFSRATNTRCYRNGNKNMEGTFASLNNDLVRRSDQGWLKGAIHSTKISGNFGLKVNGSVRSNRKSFEKSGPPFEVDLFSRLDRSDRNGPFHLTIPTHFQSQDLAVRYLPCTKWRKIPITALLRIVNSRSIGVTRTAI